MHNLVFTIVVDTSLNERICFLSQTVTVITSERWLSSKKLQRSLVLNGTSVQGIHVDTSLSLGSMQESEERSLQPS